MKKFRLLPPRRLLALALGAALLTASGCAAKGAPSSSQASSAAPPSSSQAPSSSAPAPLQKVTLVLDWTPNTNHTGLYLARDLGYYRAQGLQVDIEQPPEDGALSLLASGKAQFAVSFEDEIGTALTADKPLDVVAVAALIQHNDSGIISLKSKGIVSPKKMEGRRYATWNSPIELATIRSVVEKDGGDFNKIKRIPTDVEDVVAALKTNIDCVWVYYPQEALTCKVKGLDTNYFFFRNLDPALDFYTPVLAASGSYLKAHPDAAKKFLAATAQGYEYAIAHPDEAAARLVKDAPGLDPNVAKLGQEWLAGQYKAEVKQWGYIDAARWNRYYGFLWDSRVLKKQIAANAGFTDAYLPANG